MGKTPALRVIVLWVVAIELCADLVRTRWARLSQVRSMLVDG